MVSMQMSFLSQIVGIALLGSSLVIASVAGAVEEQSATPTQSESETSWTLSPDERASVSKVETGVRSNIEVARGAISKADADDVVKVREQLEQARNGLEAILQASPGVRIKAQIYAAATRIQVEDSADVVVTLGEIQQELSELKTARSAPVVQGHVKAAEQYLNDGEKRAAFEALQAADQEVVLDRPDVPAAETYYLVNVALAALENQDTEVVVEALNAASRSFDAFTNAFGTTGAGAPATS